jgi:outer membrane lipoprotein-sorting protein
MPAVGLAADDDLAKILKQMDDASQRFKTASADFEWDQYQAVLPDEADVQKGTIAFERKGTETRMAARLREHTGKPINEDLLYEGGQLQYWQPLIKKLDVFSSGQNRSQYESFLTLGFGGSGSDLDKNWTIVYGGMEMVGGVNTAKLQLTPKQDGVKKTFTKVTIWVDPTRSVSLKQVFEQPSGDKRTAIYSDIKYNKRLGEDVFQLKIPSSVKATQR